VVLNNGGNKNKRRLIMENSGHLRCWPLAHALRSDQHLKLHALRTFTSIDFSFMKGVRAFL
jgi:hypothetical protein